MYDAHSIACCGWVHIYTGRTFSQPLLYGTGSSPTPLRHPFSHALLMEIPAATMLTHASHQRLNGGFFPVFAMRDPAGVSVHLNCGPTPVAGLLVRGVCDWLVTDADK